MSYEKIKMQVEKIVLLADKEDYLFYLLEKTKNLQEKKLIKKLIAKFLH